VTAATPQLEKNPENASTTVTENMLESIGQEYQSCDCLNGCYNINNNTFNIDMYISWSNEGYTHSLTHSLMKATVY